jgi:hypothetical protein
MRTNQRLPLMMIAHHYVEPPRLSCLSDCLSLDIHTQSNLSELEVVSLVHELIPRYRLRAETEFACSNEDFLQTPRINGSDFEPLNNTQIRALLDYYGKKDTSNNGHISSSRPLRIVQ